MEALRSDRRTDEQLYTILFETGSWVVNGTQGNVLGSAASLQRVIDRASAFAKSDAVVVSVSHLAPKKITVFPEQIERIKRLISANSLPPGSSRRVR
jgi:hypothetical protein